MKEKEQSESNISRAEFMRDALRWLALGGLGAVAALLGRRGKDNPAAGHRCVGNGICRGCPSLPACKLPTAMSMKKSLWEKGENG